jgi:hypothetical protein
MNRKHCEPPDQRLFRNSTHHILPESASRYTACIALPFAFNFIPIVLQHKKSSLRRSEIVSFAVHSDHFCSKERKAKKAQNCSEDSDKEQT